MGEDIKSLVAKLSSTSSKEAAETVEELIGIGGPAVKQLVACLKSEDYQVCSRASEALTKIGEPAVKPLISSLKGKNEHARYLAIKTLGLIGDERAIVPLITCLEDKDESIRTMTIESLAGIGEPVIEPLIKQKVRGTGAVRILAKIGEPAVETLIELLKGEDWQTTAAEALGEIGDPRATEALINCLSDEDTRLCRYAAEALGKIKDPRAIDPLISCLKYKDYNARSFAVEALGNIGDAKATEPLVACFKDKSDYVRALARTALYKIEEPAVRSLIACLKDKDKNVRSLAEETLINIGKPAIKQLKAYLEEEKDSGLRYLPSRVLHKIEKPAAAERHAGPLMPVKKEAKGPLLGREESKDSAEGIKDLLKDLQDEDSSVRGEAIEALGEAGTKDAVEPLIAILKDDEDEENRQLAAVALGDIRDERAIGPLIEALDDEGLETIREDWGPFTKPSHYAAIALERFGIKAVEPLIEAFESREFDDVKLYIATSLGKMGYTRALSSMKDALRRAPGGPDAVIREAISAIIGHDYSEEDEDE